MRLSGSQKRPPRIGFSVKRLSFISRVSQSVATHSLSTQQLIPLSPVNIFLWSENIYLFIYLYIYLKKSNAGCMKHRKHNGKRK